MLEIIGNPLPFDHNNDDILRACGIEQLIVADTLIMQNPISTSHLRQIVTATLYNWYTKSECRSLTHPISSHLFILENKNKSMSYDVQQLENLILETKSERILTSCVQFNGLAFLAENASHAKALYYSLWCLPPGFGLYIRECIGEDIEIPETLTHDEETYSKRSFTIDCKMTPENITDICWYACNMLHLLIDVCPFDFTVAYLYRKYSHRQIAEKILDMLKNTDKKSALIATIITSCKMIETIASSILQYNVILH